MIYSSIEKLIQKENYNILYPSKLPDNIFLEKVSQQNIDETYSILSFHFNDKNLSMSISNQLTVSENDLQNCEKYQLSDVTFYIASKPNNIYQAIAIVNGYEYRILYNSYENLVIILDNMKGTES